MKQWLFKLRSYTPIPFLIWGLWVSQFNLTWFIIGLVVGLPGELIRLWAVGHAGSITRTRHVQADELITTGPYSYVRNPLYTGNLLIYLGLILAMHPAWLWLPLVVLVFFLLQYTFIVQLEEETLTDLFGDAYHEYRQHVPRLIPRLTPWKRHTGKRAMDWQKAFKSEERTLEAFALTVFLIIVVRAMHVCGG